MIQSHVFIDQKAHRYYDVTGKEYFSVSKILDQVEHPFDKSIARYCAGKGDYVGMTEQQVLDAWEKNRDAAGVHGTRIHNAIEHYTNFKQVTEADQDLFPMLVNIHADYTDYLRVYSEVILYSKRFPAAGTTDRLLVVNAKKGGFADIEDYKTNISKGIQFTNKNNQYMKGPVEHLQQCNFNRYALQLSIYGVMYEELTLNKVRSLWIRYIPPDNPLNHRKIHVPYLKHEALAVLEYGTKCLMENNNLSFTQPAF